jgi:hypothetical protein
MTTRFSFKLVLLLGTLALLLSPVLAKSIGQGNSDKHKGQGWKDQEDQGEDYDRNERGGRPIFHTRDRQIIVEFYRSQPSNLPPGLAKRNGNLPPGLEKHLERNGTLPPGLQKRVEPLPEALEARLPPLPDNCRRGIIGAHVIILDRKTGAILDIIRDVAVLAGH